MKKLLFGLTLFAVFSLTSLQLEAQNEDAALEVIGGATAIALYNSYSTIGLAADAWHSGVYEQDFMGTLMDEQLGMYENLRTQYEKLLSSGYLTSEDDRQFMQEAVDILSILSQQASTLKTYVSSGETEHATQFETYRQNAWEKIAKLLGL
jgi:hypothetical protein